MYYLRIFVLLAPFLALIACSSQQVTDDPILATVHDRQLRLSHASNYISEGASAKDSLSQLRGYVEQWVRDMVLLHEAEEQFPTGLNINELVLDYRNSLIISNYEKDLVETQLDTVITMQELQEYYQRNREQYQLDYTIVRGNFVKLPRSSDSLRQFREWWDSSDSTDFVHVVDYSIRHAEVFIVEDSTWYKVDELERLMPPGTLRSENMRANTSFRFSDDDFEYYLRISESVLSREIAPLSYIREQAERFIMHKRKLELLEDIKRSLYERDMQENHIKIYVK